MAGRWLHSPGFDLGLIIGPPLLEALTVLAVPQLRSGETPVWAWVVFVVFVDVAHVYSSLYRVYFDRPEFLRRKSLYLNVPMLCWAAGVLLYRVSALVFWRALAYTAVFHFVRQQYGFMRIYQRSEKDGGRLDAWLDSAAVYSSILYPLAFWHADPARRFVWFVDGDFLRLPFALPKAVGWLYGAVLALFALRQAQRGPNWPKIGLVFSTAAAWYIGIVALNSDLAFTVTNVVAHGIPYIALVWLYGSRKWDSSPSWLGRVHRPSALWLFLLPLLILAYGEEWLWDALVWKEHARVFGGALLNRHWTAPADLLGHGVLSLLVPLLALPQATHYVLDAWIWKFDGSNPGLKEYVFGAKA